MRKRCFGRRGGELRWGFFCLLRGVWRFSFLGETVKFRSHSFGSSMSSTREGKKSFFGASNNFLDTDRKTVSRIHLPRRQEPSQCKQVT